MEAGRAQTGHDWLISAAKFIPHLHYNWKPESLVAIRLLGTPEWPPSRHPPERDNKGCTGV